MKKAAILLVLSFSFWSFSFGASAQNKQPPTTLRGVLLEQLRDTHDTEDWFVPAKIAVAGLTAEQA